MTKVPWVTAKSAKDGAYWLVIQVAIGLLPLWGTALLLTLFGRHYEMYDLMRNGEFVLYAASFVTSGLYSVRYDIFPLKNGLHITLILLLVVATLVFASVSVLNIGDHPNWLVVNKDTLEIISIAVFVIATFVCFGITVAEAGSAGLNVPEVIRRDRQKLEQGLDDLINKGGGQ